MGKLGMYNFITLNGYFKGQGGDISWHVHGEEENAFAAEMLGLGDILLFGRITYEMMASYWPTEFAIKNDPVVAKSINMAEKIVFSTTLQKADWNNTRLMSKDIVEEVRMLKEVHGKNMTILGSGSIVNQFAEKGLIDEYQFMIDPVILGSGAVLFEGIKKNLSFKLVGTRTFKSGVVLLNYQKTG
jgi:dihydrofolate reductase